MTTSPLSPPRSLQQFYELMGRTRDVRARTVERYLAGADAAADDLGELRRALGLLHEVPRDDAGWLLSIDDETAVQ